MSCEPLAKIDKVVCRGVWQFVLLDVFDELEILGGKNDVPAVQGVVDRVPDWVLMVSIVDLVLQGLALWWSPSGCRIALSFQWTSSLIKRRTVKSRVFDYSCLCRRVHRLQPSL